MPIGNEPDGSRNTSPTAGDRNKAPNIVFLNAFCPLFCRALYCPDHLTGVAAARRLVTDFSLAFRAGVPEDGNRHALDQDPHG
jgi:hypothetical protein